MAAPEQASHETSTEFYEDVATLLENELMAQSHRSDLRFKLLEVYAATHRRDEFIREASVHLERESVAPGHDSYRARILALGRRVAPGHPLFDAGEDDADRHPDAQSGSSRRFYESIDTAALQRTQPAIQKAHGYLRTKPGFWRELRQLTSEQCVSESRLVYAESLSVYLGGAQIYVRDDVKRPITEASTINAVGQALIARHLGCTRLFAGAAGAGHIEAVAEIAKTLNMEPVLFATEKDQVQQGSRIARISLDGVQVRYIGNARTARTEGQRAALAAALEDPNDCFYVSPVDAGPHPYPVIVQDLLGMTGRELRLQIMSLAGQLPRAIVVNDADSMNAVGYLHAFIDVRQVELTCVQSAAPHRRGRKRLAREHAWLGATGRVRYTSVADEVARYAALNLTPNQAMQKLRLSGGEVMAEAIRLARQMDVSQSLVAVLPVAPPLATLA